MLHMRTIKEVFGKMEKEEVTEFTNGRYDFWIMEESLSQYCLVDRVGRKLYYYDKYFKLDETIDMEDRPLNKFTVEWN